MAKITDGTFRDWQDTETINAAEYKRERELLKVAINDNDDRLVDLQQATSAIQLGTAQLSKITNDTGGVKISVTSSSGNILQELLNAGQGLHTFYAVSGSQQLPPTNVSIRGIAHFTNAKIGWVYATDYLNNIFTNYYDTDTWQGWKQLVSASATQTQLWTDATGYYMNAGQTVTPTKKLSECRNGWILMWSDFNPPSTPNNYNWVSTTIPKFMGTKHSGNNWSESFSAGTTTGQADTVATKEFTVFDDKIVGNDNNSLGLSADVVLRYVIEW